MFNSCFIAVFFLFWCLHPITDEHETCPYYISAACILYSTEHAVLSDSAPPLLTLDCFYSRIC